MPTRSRLLGFVASAIMAAMVSGCSKNQAVDFAMRSAPRAPIPAERVGGYLLLAGDLHCHVLPPDSPSHVSRDLATTVDLATSERLDFVVLTPHVPARFFLDADVRQWVFETQHELRAALSKIRTDVLVIPGFEYTDHRYGHVGAGFADVDQVLADVPLTVAQRNPARFFERWVARGGLLTINHPLLRGLPAAPLSPLRANMSWRAFGPKPPPLPAEVAWITAHAQTIETYNLSLSFLRDRFFVGDEERSLREAAHLVDREVRRQHRPITAVGGSDSHGEYLRATTYVLAAARDPASIRDGIVAGRTCVRAPETCTLRARGDGAEAIVGGDVRSRREGGRAVVEARVVGAPADFVVNGAVAAHGASGEWTTVPVPGDRCTVLRAIAGASWSSGLRVDCDRQNAPPSVTIEGDASGAATLPGAIEPDASSRRP